MNQFPLPSKTPLVLIVDDDRAMRGLLRLAIAKEDYRVIDAKNGEECLDKYTQFQPDIVLLDAIMPEMDGFMCCERLRSFPETTYLPILMITALDDQESVERAFIAGATDYITKPIYWTVLSRRVKHFLETSRSLKHLDYLTRQWQKHQQWQKLLQQIAQELSQPYQFSSFLNESLFQLKALTTAQRVGLHQVDGTLWAEVMDRGYPSVKRLPWQSLTLFPQNETIYQNKQIAIIHPYQPDNLSDEILGAFKQLTIKTLTLLPILKKGEVWGILWIHHCQEFYVWETGDQESLSFLGDLLAIACR